MRKLHLALRVRACTRVWESVVDGLEVGRTDIVQNTT